MNEDRIKRPAYQWHVLDARGDEVFMLMSYEQQGVYRALLDQQWIEGSIPADPATLAAMLKISPTRFAKIWPLISGKFRPRLDRLVNDRLESYRRELDTFVKIQAENGTRGAAKRWGRHSTAIATPMANDSSVSVSTSVKTVAKEQQQVPTAKAPSPAKEFLTWFQAEYKTRRHGATYFVSWEKHMPIVGRLLKLHDPLRLRMHATLLLTTNEDWTETTDRGIEVLAGKINWLEDRLARHEAAKRAREAV